MFAIALLPLALLGVIAVMMTLWLAFVASAWLSLHAYDAAVKAAVEAIDRRDPEFQETTLGRFLFTSANMAKGTTRFLPFEGLAIGDNKWLDAITVGAVVLTLLASPMHLVLGFLCGPVIVCSVTAAYWQFSPYYELDYGFNY